jgi:hypothetical protein
LVFQLERSQDTAGTPTAPFEGLEQEMAGDESSLINSSFAHHDTPLLAVT